MYKHTHTRMHILSNQTATTTTKIVKCGQQEQWNY